MEIQKDIQCLVEAILSVEDGDKISAGDVIARIPREGAKN